MSKSFREDLTGQRFGRLTVMGFVPNDRHGAYWKCKCDCEKIIVTRGVDLKRGKTKSCGCLMKEKATKHGSYRTRLYKIWQDMHYRCKNQSHKNYKNYGGRGIEVCIEWNDFVNFREWSLTHGYSDKLTIDRIDVNGNYEPNNCRWADMKTQCRNMRKNVIVEYKGKKMCLSEAAERSGISSGALKTRYERGDRGERLFRAVQKRNK